MNISKYLPNIISLIYIVLILPILLIIPLIFPTAIELPLFYYWQYEGILNGFFESWPIFVWAFVITSFSLIFSDQDTLKRLNILYVKYSDDGSSLFKCFIDSLLIGIVEEIYYRWLSFYLNILTTKITNFFLFGICRYFYLYIEAPLTNIIFFNKLRWLLYDQVHWSIGSSAIITNGIFRNDHAYLGYFGYFNSWCIGFFQFWIMMNYGLPAAICSHVFYDFIIFSMYFIHGVLLRKRRYQYYQHYSITKTSISSSRLKESV